MNEPAIPENHRRHWQRNLQLTAALLCVWFIVTFVLVFFARDLDFRFFGWPFSFWVAAQGALLVYLGLVAYYAWAMSRLDHEDGVAEET